MNVILPFIRRRAADIADDANLAAYEAEMREQCAFDLAHPRFDPQHQPDGHYYDAEAERLGDLAELQYARSQAAPAAHSCEQSELLADLSEHPIWDDRLQPGGLADICHGADVAVGFFEHPDPAPQLVPDSVLELLHNTVATKSAQAMVAAAVKSWMDGDPLTQREQRIVDVVCDTNYASQIGRLCLPSN